MGSHFDHYEKAAIARGKKIGDAAMYARTPEGQKTLLRTVGYGLSMVPGVGLPASAALLGATEGGVHYLVAIRGRDPRIGSGGEAAPNIGIYAAANPEKLVDDILKGGRWSTMNDGTFKDIVFYPKEAIDPRADVRNITHDTDAYHGYPSWHKHRDATLPPEVSDKMAREYGEQHPVPGGMYTELGNAYRNRIYEQNPARGFNKDASLGMTPYGGYGEAMPRRYVQDGLRISGEEIKRNPKGARKKLLDAIEQFKFTMPMGVGVGIGGAALETQEAAKAGDTDYTAHEESTGPTDEQLEEAVEFLETVMEIGAPQNEWEQSIVQRTHDILKASIGMPRKEREPENPAPAQGGTNEDAGGGDTDEDDNGPSPEDPRANDTSLPQERTTQVQRSPQEHRSPQEQDVQVQRSPQEHRSPQEQDVQVQRSPQERPVQVQRSPQEQDVQVQRSPQEQDVQVQRSPQERPVQVQRSPQEQDVGAAQRQSVEDGVVQKSADGFFHNAQGQVVTQRVAQAEYAAAHRAAPESPAQPQEGDNGSSPEDPHANNTSPQPDTNPVNDRVMHETEDINKPDDSAVTGEKQGVQASVDRSGLKALLLHADNDNEDEEI